jgi:hypothetical protein
MVNGFVELADGRVAMKSPLLAAKALMRIQLKSKEFVLTNLEDRSTAFRGRAGSATKAASWR